MQLLYITSSRIPGERAHSIQIIKTVDALLSKGVRVTLIAPRRRNPFAESIHDLKKFYGLNNNINIIRLPTLDVLFAFRDKTFAFILLNVFFCVWLLPYILFMRIFCRNLVIFIREQLLLILIGAFSSFLKPLRSSLLLFQQSMISIHPDRSLRFLNSALFGQSAPASASVHHPHRAAA